MSHSFLKYPEFCDFNNQNLSEKSELLLKHFTHFSPNFERAREDVKKNFINIKKYEN